MAFATSADVETRLARDLTAAEIAAADLLLDGVASEIAIAVGKTVAEITDPQDGLRFLSIEAVARVLANPTGAQSTSETIGAYSYSVNHGRRDDAPLLTAAEERQARMVVWGRGADSVRIESVTDDVIDLLEDGEVGS